MLPGRQGLAGRLWPELGEDRLQCADAGREREAVAVDGVAQQPRERGRFFVC